MDDWKTYKLINLAKFINGFAFKPEHWGREGLPIVRIEQLKKNDAKFDYCSKNIPKDNIIDDGDLIFSWSASLFLKIWDRGIAALNQHLFKVIPFSHIDKFFLKYLIEYNLEELTKAAHGSTMQHITRKELEKYNVKIPQSLPEQTRIAQILSQADEAIAQTEALIAKYQRIKTGLMQDLLTRGIDSQGQIRSEATHAFKDSPLGRIPVEWEVVTFGDLISAIDPQPDHRTPASVEVGVPYLGINDIDELGNIDYRKCRKVSYSVLNEHNNRYQLQKGDIIFGKIGTVGSPKRLIKTNDITLSANLILIKPKNRTDYVYWLLNSQFVNQQVKNSIHSTSQPAYGIEKIRKIIIPSPHELEQRNIADKLNEINESIQHQQSHLAKLQSIKRGLMQDLLSGRVRVSTPQTHTTA